MGKICHHLYCNRRWFCNTQSTSFPRVPSPPRTQFNNICGCNAPLYILWCVKWLYNTTHTQLSLCHGSRWVLFTARTQSVTLKRRFTRDHWRGWHLYNMRKTLKFKAAINVSTLTLQRRSLKFYSGLYFIPVELSRCDDFFFYSGTPATMI